MVTYPSLCSTCVTYGTLCHAIGHQVLPTQPLSREAEDFSRGDRHFKHVPPLTYLICLSPKDLHAVGSIEGLGLLRFVKNLLHMRFELFPRQA